MNDDLISREAVIKAVDRHTREDGTLDEDISVILEEVKTAFNKENVMNEIKEYKKDAEEWVMKPIENADEFSTYIDAYKNCLEIVEKGGVE